MHVWMHACTRAVVWYEEKAGGLEVRYGGTPPGRLKSGVLGRRWVMMILSRAVVKLFPPIALFFESVPFRPCATHKAYPHCARARASTPGWDDGSARS